jgi:hypothetical protein
MDKRIIFPNDNGGVSILMPDANYSSSFACDEAQQLIFSGRLGGTNPSTTNIRVRTRNGSSVTTDAEYVFLSFFR